MTTVKSGQTWSGLIVCKDSTGALATPSVGPAGTLYVDGTSNAASVTVSGSNPYKWTVTLPTLTAGQCVSMYITATIATIATASVVAEDVADTVRLSDVPAVNVTTVMGTGLTESGAGRLAAAFSTFGDVASPVFTAASVGQTGDSFARLGAPAGASVSADIDAVSAQISAIGSGTGAALNYAVVGDNASAPLQGVTAVGTQAGTYANTLADDGTTHQIASVGNAIDWVYQFDVGAARAASKLNLRANMAAAGDTVTVSAYNFLTTSWEARKTITGTTETQYGVPLLAGHTGTGANEGKVYIRFQFSEGDAGTLVIDEAYVQAQQSGSLVGYAGGAIWVNTNASNTNTVPYIDGTADNPVSTWAAALALSAATSIKRFRIAAVSSITLTGNSTAYEFLGDGLWSLALGGQNISSAYVQKASVSGTGSGSSTIFEDCQINAGASTGPAYFVRCGFGTTSGSPFLAAVAGQYVIVDCVSIVAGSGTPYFNFAGTGGATGVNFRRWSGGSHITGDSNVTGTMEVVTGGGQTLVTGGGNFELRGICRAVTVTSIAGSTTQIAAVTGPVTINGTGGTVNIYGVTAAVTDNSGGTVTVSNNAVSRATVNIEADAALADYDPPTNAEMEARTLLAANYFDPAADTVANVTTVGSVTAGVTLADDAITAGKFDEVTAFPLSQADSGSTEIARSGDDGDTLETLSDQLDALNNTSVQDILDGMNATPPKVKLAGGVNHADADAQLILKRLYIYNPDPFTEAILVSAPDPSSVGIRVADGITADLAGTIDGLTATAQDHVRDAVAAELADYDPPTKAEMDSGFAGLNDLSADAVAALINDMAQPDWRSGETSSGALADLYNDNAIDALTGNPTNLTAEGSDGFAAWVLQEYDGELFVGVGKTPMNHVAAVIGSLSSVDAVTAPSFEYALPEEGVADMAVGPDGALYVTGVDERANTGDGSIYIRTSGVWTRKKTLTGFYHVFGMCFDAGNRLWVAGQGPSGVMYSIDGGDTWNSTSIGPSERNYDVIALGSAIIVTTWDPLPWWPVYRSTNTGVLFNQVLGIESGIARMVLWGDVVVGLSHDGDLFAIDSSGVGTSYTLPFTAAQVYNALAVDSKAYLCVLAQDGSVWRSVDLATWRKVWTPVVEAGAVKAIGVFGDNLVVSTSGDNAAIYIRPASPEYATEQLTRDAMKLAPSGGASLPTSIDNKLDLGAKEATAQTILHDTSTTIPGTLITLPASIEALLVAEHGDGLWTDSSGTGSIMYPYLVENPSGDPIPHARVVVTTDEDGNNRYAMGYTDAFGYARFHLDAGAYYFWTYAPGYAVSRSDPEVVV